MPIITVTSAGSTSLRSLLSLHLAHGMALTGLRVAMVDLTKSRDVSEFFIEKPDSLEPCYHDVRESLDLIPSYVSLIEFASRRGLHHSAPIEHIARTALADYDVTFLEIDHLADAKAWDFLAISDFIFAPMSEPSRGLYDLKNHLVELGAEESLPPLLFIRATEGNPNSDIVQAFERRLAFLREQIAYDYYRMHNITLEPPEILATKGIIGHSMALREAWGNLQTIFDLDFERSSELLERGAASTTTQAVTDAATETMAIVEEVSELLFHYDSFENPSSLQQAIAVPPQDKRRVA